MRTPSDGISASAAVRVSLIVIALSACVNKCVAQLDATDVLIASRQNLQQPATMHVTWDLVEYRHPFWYELNAKNAQVLDAVRSSAESARSQEQATKAKSAVNANSATPATTSRSFDAWITREGYQLHYSAQLGLQSIRFPSALATEANLETQFGNLRVFLQIPGKPEYKLWTGLSGPKKEPRGIIAQGFLADAEPTFVLPPIGGVPAAWGGNRISHEIDRLITNKEAGTLASEEVNGKRRYVIEWLVSSPAPDALKAAGHDIKVVDRVISHFDPQQGYLPISTSWYKDLVLDGVPLSKSTKVDPYRTLVISAVTSRNGAYYPTEIAYTQYSGLPPKPEERLSIADMLNGKRVYSPMAPTSTLTWKVRNLDLNAEITNDSLVFDFPKGTHYFDADGKRGLIKGLSEADLDKLLQSEADFFRDPGRRSWLSFNARIVILTITTVVAVVVAVVVWVIRRK